MVDTERAVAAVHEYIAAYAEQDVNRKRQMIAASVTESGVYSSPSAELNRDEIVEMVSGAHLQGSLTVTSEIRVHHQFLTFDWLIADLEGIPMMSGVDFCVAADDGRLQQIVVFMNERI